jgi:hypothetical protein
LSKFILIGQVWRLEKRRFVDRPLIYTTLYSALVFSLLVIGISALERVVKGWLHHKAVAETFHEILSQGSYETLARCLLTFIVFVPYFAFRQIGELVGQDKMLALFLHKRSALTVQSPDGTTSRAST